VVTRKGLWLCEGLLLRLGETVEDAFETGLVEAGSLLCADLNPRAESLLGHRNLDAFDLLDQLGELRLGLHQRPRYLDH
jgi:hypothetical protein